MPDIRNLTLAEIKPWPRNARLHSRRQVKQPAQSIRRFGLTHPILIERRGALTKIAAFNPEVRNDATKVTA